MSKSIDLGNLSFAKELVKKYIENLGTLGHEKEQIDSIVLGCTHYPLISNIIQEIVGKNIKLFDTAKPVTTQTKRITKLEPMENIGSLYFSATGKPEMLSQACEKFLEIKQEAAILNI